MGATAFSHQGGASLLGAGSPKRRIRQRTPKAIAVEGKRDASCTREVYAFGHTSVSKSYI